MSTIQFKAVVGPDRVIRQPAGVALPEGDIEVSVRPRTAVSAIDPLVPTRAWLLAFAEEAELAQPNLPPDMAEQHDHYANGVHHELGSAD